MITATPPPAIVTPQIDFVLDHRGGVIQVPIADGVSAQIVYPASDLPAGERVHVEAVGPVGVKSLGVDSFGGNRNYAPYYQIKITLNGPAAGVVHIYGAPKMILNATKPPAAGYMVYYSMQITFGGTRHGIGMGATGKGCSTEFDLAHVPPLLKHGEMTVTLTSPVLMTARISRIELAATLEGRVEDALRRLDLYKRSRSLGDLQTAIEAMQSSLDVHLLQAATYTVQRRTFVNGWAEVLRAIEDAYDPKFDPSRLLPCPLPRFYNGLVPQGCDPKLIHDPQNDSVSKKERENLNRYQVSYENYTQVQRLDDWAMTALDSSLQLLRKIEPDGTPADSLALDAALRAAGLSETRRQKIYGWFYARQGPCLYVRLWPC